MNRPLSIHPAVLQRLQELPKTERIECLLALCERPTAFGRPQLHSGLGIRKLTKKAFEFRGNISLRFIFEDRATDLFITFLGKHDEIKTLLQNGKYR